MAKSSESSETTERYKAALHERYSEHDKRDARSKAYDALESLLSFFGKPEQEEPRLADDPEQKRRSTGLGDDDPAARVEEWDRELYAAALVAFDILQDLHALPRPQEVLKRKKSNAAYYQLIDRWNEAICTNAWLHIAPLCSECGLAVFARRPQRLPGGDVDIGTCCGDPCRNRKNAREGMRRKRKKEK